jgi:hypothetical protein
MARLRQLVPPIIVAAVEVFDGRGGKFGRIDMIQRRQAHGNIVAADFFEVAMAMRGAVSPIPVPLRFPIEVLD